MDSDEGGELLLRIKFQNQLLLHRVQELEARVYALTTKPKLDPLTRWYCGQGKHLMNEEICPEHPTEYRSRRGDAVTR